MDKTMNFMHKTNESNENNDIVTTRGPRYERNRKYWLKNIEASLRSTLLHNVKSNGRIPSNKTIKKYDLMPEELIKNWRFYKEKIGEDIPPLKKLKFEILIRNLL